MKHITPCLAIMLVGLVVAASSSFALATAPPARGGHAVTVHPKTQKAPPQFTRVAQGEGSSIPGRDVTPVQVTPWPGHY